MAHKKYWDAKWVIASLLCLVATQVLGGIVGSFEGAHNLPGYIDLDPQSPWYQGVLKQPRDKQGIELRTPSHIIADYFTNGRLATDKIAALIAEVEALRYNAFVAYCMEKLPEGARDNHYCRGRVDDQKLLTKWAKKEANVVLQMVVSELTHARQLGERVALADINQPSSEEFLEVFFNALSLYEGVKGEDYQLGRHTGINRVVFDNVNYLFFKSTYSIDEGRVEAANLLVPVELRQRFPGQKFLSRRNLEELTEQGYDISTLDPPSSGMWRRPEHAIASYDLRRYDGAVAENLAPTLGAEGAAKMLEPEEVVDIVYQPEKFGQGDTAKLYGQIGKDRWKVKFLTDKVSGINTSSLLSVMEMAINAAEVNVEGAVNNLAAALGFTVDPTYYKYKIRLFFPDEVYAEDRFEAALEEMVVAIQGSLAKNVYVRTAFQNIKVDPETGRRYIEMRSVSLEKKSERSTEMSIGLFEREGLGRTLQREHRAFSLFLAWIADIDPKNENGRLKVLPTTTDKGEASYKIAYSNSDMGAALGFGLPNYLSRQFITNVKRHRDGRAKRVTFEYRKIYPAAILDSLSLNDARWLGRRLAQLTPEQMHDAFASAGFPEPVAQVYALKMMGRRNQLLEALDLVGKTTLDDAGQPVVIERYEEFSGVVPGYEHLFKDGVLTDPNNEIFDPERESFPRYWGTYWRQTKDKPQSILWNHLGLRFLNQSALLLVNFVDPGAYYTGYGPTFAGINLYRGSSLFGSCNGNCFFQGIGFGVGTFVPLRFIVDNPDPDSPEPFLVVDLFRIGLSVGDNIRGLEEMFDLGIPLAEGVRIGAHAFKIYEFMKIRAVASVDDYVHGYKASFKQTPKLMFEKAKRQFIESMEPGDSMILSSYMGARGRVRVAPLQGLTLVSPQVGVKGGVVLTSRVTLHKADDEQMLVNWAKIDYEHGEAVAGIKALLNFDIAGVQKLHNRQKERTFAFNIQDPQEKAFLMSHLSTHAPKSIPESYSLRKRQTRLKQNRFSVGFFTVFNDDHITRKIEVDLYDYLNRTRAKELSYEKLLTHSVMKDFNFRTRSYAYKASINDAFDPFIKVTFDMHLPEARERHFLENLSRIDPLVPDDFIVFDPVAVKEYLGDLDFRGTTIFSHKALAYMFAAPDRELCEAYVRVNPFAMGGHYCDQGNRWPRDHHLRAFMQDFAIARSSYQKLLALRHEGPAELGERRRQVFRQLRDFVDIFDHYNKRYRIVKVMRQLLPPDSYYQEAILSSSLAGFPMDDNEIEISMPQRGSFRPGIRHLADAPEDVYQLFSDSLHDTVTPFFFDPYYQGAFL